MVDAGVLLANVDASITEELAIDAKLAEVIEALGAHHPLRTVLGTLSGNATAGRRLEAYQAIRDAQVLPADAGFFLVAHAVEALGSAHVYARQETDPIFRKIRRDSQALRKARDSQDDWTPESEAEAAEALDAEWSSRAEHAIAAVMRSYNEVAISNLYFNDRDAYWSRFDAGRRFFLDDGQASRFGPRVRP